MEERQQSVTNSGVLAAPTFAQMMPMWQKWLIAMVLATEARWTDPMPAFVHGPVVRLGQMKQTILPTGPGKPMPTAKRWQMVGPPRQPVVM
jgi:hypothetical protein